MKNVIIFLLYCSSGILSFQSAVHAQKSFAIAIHGGAGAIRKMELSPERESAYRKSLELALDLGTSILTKGGSALDAVEQVIVMLENDSLFNAGKGAVFNAEGKHELDASIMDGHHKKAGAAGGLKRIKNPIRLARAIMEHSGHVFLVGSGAEAFGLLYGIDTVSNSWFDTDFRRAYWLEVLEQKKSSGDLFNQELLPKHSKMGTVGCVALDQSGHLAAGTSTGGMTDKRWGRIGDSPVIGAGCYAEDGYAAVSCTGSGEYFIREVVAYDLVARMKYKGMSLNKSAESIIHGSLKKMGGEGGLIAIDSKGRVAMPYNSEGMYRAYTNGKVKKIQIYQND